MNIHSHEYGLIYLILSLHLQVSCARHWLCLNQEFWGGSNSLIQWVHGYTKETIVFYCKITIPRQYSLLQCLHTLAFLNHHFCVQPLVFVCFLKNDGFFHELIVTKSQSSLILIPHSLKTKQTPLFSCCQPQAPCSVERGFPAFGGLHPAKQSLFHKPARMWGGMNHRSVSHPKITNIQRPFTIILVLLNIF